MGFHKVFAVFSIAMMIYMDDQAQTGRPLTLQQCVQAAFTNNPDVKQTDFQQQREGVTLRQSKANLLPNVSAGVDHTLNQGRSIDLGTNTYINQQYTSAQYSLSGSVMLFNGLRLLNSLKSNQYAYEASRMEWQQSKDKLMLDVILAYLQILNNTDLLSQAQKQAEVTQKQVERLELMNREGAIKPSDLTDMKGLLADNKLSIVNIQNNLDAAKLSLAQLMNVPFNANLQVERLTPDQFDMSYVATPDSIYQVALQQLAMVKATELRKKSAEKQVQAIRGYLYPAVRLNAGYSTTFFSTGRDSTGRKIGYYDQLSNNYGTGVGIGINIPILNNFYYRNQVALAKINLKSAEFTAQTTQIQLKQAIERDHFNMTAALNKYQALADQVTAYTESFRAAEARFNEGAITSVDYLIVKNNLDRANVNLIIARYDYVLRTRILDFYQGKPLW